MTTAKARRPEPATLGFNSAVLKNQPYTPSPITTYPITAGNIQVHFNS